MAIALFAAGAAVAPLWAGSAAAGPTVDGLYDGAGIVSANTETQLVVAGRGGVPAGATAAVLNLTVTGATGAGWASVYPCGTPRPNASNINFTANSTIAGSAITKLGNGGMVCIYSSATTHLIADVGGYFTGASGYHALTPARYLDTRGTGAARAGTETQVTVAGRGGVPAGATAVALNLTVTGAAGGGWASVYPCGTPRPNASNINFTANSTIANSAITKLGNGGKICIYTSATTHLIADISGHFTSGYHALSPARYLDTRGTSAARAGTEAQVTVAGRGGVPAGATAVALNLTVTGAAGGGWASVYPCGTPRPNASNINFTANSTIANSAITKLGNGGKICIYTSATTHVIIDIGGHFTTAESYSPLSPARLLDTRPTDPAAVAEAYSRTLVDQRRAALGLAPVALDAQMSAFARDWAGTMATTWFHHSTGPWSENIGMWQQPSLTPEQAAAGLHQAWLASPPHYANMTNPNWRYVGIGFYHDASGWYAVHEFRS